MGGEPDEAAAEEHSSREQPHSISESSDDSQPQRGLFVGYLVIHWSDKPVEENAANDADHQCWHPHTTLDPLSVGAAVLPQRATAAARGYTETARTNEAEHQQHHLAHAADGLAARLQPAEQIYPLPTLSPWRSPPSLVLSFVGPHPDAVMASGLRMEQKSLRPDLTGT